MTSNTDDKNKLIRYLYEEIGQGEQADTEQEIAKNPTFRKELKELSEAKAASEAAEVQPSERVVNRILAFGKKRKQAPPPILSYQKN